MTWLKVAAAAVVIVLAGCATPPPLQAPVPAVVETNPEKPARDAEAVGDYGAAARAWQALAAASATPAREAYQLNAAAAWLAAGDATSSLALLGQIDVAPLTDELIARKQILLARLALGRGDAGAAAAALAPTHALALPAALAAERDALQAQLPAGTLHGGGQPGGGDFLAVLLPYDGPLDDIAQAITAGIVAARMHDAGGPELRFYDSGPDAVATYGKAIADGAAGVIGPLQKAEVAALAAKPLPRPTLALNSPEPPVGQVNLFRLSLDPADEALASVRWLVSAGHREVAMLYVDDAWGERQRDLYNAALAAQGGSLRAAVPFQAGATDFAQSLRALFADRLALAAIPPVDGQVPPSQLASPGPQALVVIANAADARQIALAVTYVGLRELPLITTSQVWSGSPDARADTDLDGLVFCDSPWSLSRTTATGDGGPLSAARGVAPQLDRQPPRLLALGADAYRLAAQLRLGHTVDSLPDGATGMLNLDADGAFHRYGLGCARFSGGVPQPLPAVNAP